MKKNIKITSTLTVISLVIMVAFSSCKKDDDTTTPAAQNGTLAFHLHTMADTNEVEDYGDTLVMTGGRKISVSFAQLYLSNIKLIKTDGTVIDGPSTIVLQKQDAEEYEIGEVPAGNYKSVRFDVGLSDAVNASTPSASDQILNQPWMWFGTTAQPDGFAFINLEGSIDTTDAANGTDLIPFSYKIGTIAHRITVTMPDQNFTVAPNQEATVHMYTVYSKLFTGIQLNNSANLNVTTAADNGGSLAAQLAANIASMFRYE